MRKDDLGGLKARVEELERQMAVLKDTMKKNDLVRRTEKLEKQNT